LSDHSSSDQPGNGAGAGERRRDARQFFVGPEAVGKAPPGRSTEVDEAPERPPEAPAPAPAPVVAVSAPARGPAPRLPVEDSPPPPEPEPSPAPVLAPPSVPAAPPSPSPGAASPSAPPKFYVLAPGAPPPRESSLLGKPAVKPAKPASDGAARGPAPARPDAARPAGPPKRRRVRRRILQAVAVLELVPLVIIGAGVVWAQSKFSQIERVLLSEVLDPEVGDGLINLMVGSD
jgi:hypothetical protein